MPKPIEIQAIERAARAKLDTRIQAIKTLATARQNNLDKQAEAAAAEREDASAWIAAIRQGWREDELKDLGFDPPAKKFPARSRRRQTPAPSGRQSGTSTRRAEDGATARDGSAAEAPEPLPAG